MVPATLALPNVCPFNLRLSLGLAPVQLPLTVDGSQPRRLSSQAPPPTPQAVRCSYSRTSFMPRVFPASAIRFIVASAVAIATGCGDSTGPAVQRLAVLSGAGASDTVFAILPN